MKEYKDKINIFYSKGLKISAFVILFICFVMGIFSVGLLMYKEATFGRENLSGKDSFLDTEMWKGQVLSKLLDKQFQVDSEEERIEIYQNKKYSLIEYEDLLMSNRVTIWEKVTDADVAKDKNNMEAYTMESEEYALKDEYYSLNELQDKEMFNIVDYTSELWDARYNNGYGYYHNVDLVNNESNQFLEISSVDFFELIDQYTILNNKGSYSSFSEESFVLEGKDEFFVYSPSEEMIYNTNYGWINNYVISDAYMLYIDISDLDYSSEDAFNKSILLAPQYNSLAQAIGACLSDEQVEILDRYLYTYSYDYGYDYINNYNYAIYYVEDNTLYETKVNNNKIVNYNGEYYNDSESFSELYDDLVSRSEMVIGYDGSSGVENSVIVQNGQMEQKLFFDDKQLKQLRSAFKDSSIYIGIDKTNYSYILCNNIFPIIKGSNNFADIFIISSIIGVLCLIYLFMVAGNCNESVVLEDDKKKYKIIKNKMNFWDEKSIEFILIGAGAIAAGLIFGFWYLVESIFSRYGFLSNNFIAILITCAVVFLAGIYTLCMLVVMTTYKRIKNNTLLRSLWISCFIMFFIKRFRNGYIYYSTAGKKGKLIVVKYIGILLVNIFVVYIFLQVLHYGAFPIALLVVVFLLFFDIWQIIYFVKYILDVDRLLEETKVIAAGNLDKKIDVKSLSGNSIPLGEAINSISEGLKKAVEISIKDERMKAELITNVSHDIKTPLTSIISYVDLIKREEIDNDKVKEYISVLENKSQRLKQLTEDLVEVSKASSGNLELQIINIDLKELFLQAIGEFEEKFHEKGLIVVEKIEETDITIMADGMRCYRVIENLFQNIYKYAMPNTRIYLEITKTNEVAQIILKNISQSPLDITPEELIERFVRGDVARSTEGSGLGLSIAKNLVELHKGHFEILIDGDLFKVVVELPV